MEPIPPKCDCNRYNRLRLCVDPARLPPNVVPLKQNVYFPSKRDHLAI